MWRPTRPGPTRSRSWLPRWAPCSSPSRARRIAKGGECRRRRSSASCTSWPPPPPYSWRTRSRAAGRRSRRRSPAVSWVTFKPTILKLALAYAALGVFHYALRHRFLTISFHPEEAERQGWKIKWWDFLFYLSFGVVITLAVPVAGVLMVFSFLVVPAVIAFLFTRDMRRLAYISWGSGALASILGLWISLEGDMPTGPLIVCMYGLVLVGALVLRKLVRAPA